MATDFNAYFSPITTKQLNSFGEDLFNDGVNIQLNKKVYNLKVLETHTPEGASASLIFRAYSDQSLLVSTRGVKDIGIIGEDIVLGDKINLFGGLIFQGRVSKTVETPIFQGEASQDYTEFSKEYPTLIPKLSTVDKEEVPLEGTPVGPQHPVPNDPPDDEGPRWSRKKKVGTLFAAVVLLSAVGYGVNSVRKGTITLPTTQKISDFFFGKKEKPAITA